MSFCAQMSSQNNLRGQLRSRQREEKGPNSRWCRPGVERFVLFFRLNKGRIMHFCYFCSLIKKRVETLKQKI